MPYKRRYRAGGAPKFQLETGIGYGAHLDPVHYCQVGGLVRFDACLFMFERVGPLKWGLGCAAGPSALARCTTAGWLA